MLSSILTGQGNLTLNANNGNINMQSLQDQYYYYSKHELTNLDIGALIAEILAAIIIGAFTAGAGAAFVVAAELSTVVVDTALAVALAVSVATNAAVVGAGVAALGVGLGVGMNAAIDNKNNGAGATKDMQTGFSDSTTKQYGAKVGNSLLFGGSVNLVHGSTGSANIDKANNIQSNSLNQTANNNESALFSETHSNITPNWNSLMTEAAIIGVISGVTVAGGDALLKMGEESAKASIKSMTIDNLISDAVDGTKLIKEPGMLGNVYNADASVKDFFNNSIYNTIKVPENWSLIRDHAYPSIPFWTRTGLENAVALPPSSGNNN